MAWLSMLVAQAMSFSDRSTEAAYRQHNVLKWVVWDLLLAAFSATVLLQQKHELLENVVLGCQTSSSRYFQHNMLQSWMGWMGPQNDPPGLPASGPTQCLVTSSGANLAYLCEASKLDKVVYMVQHWHSISAAMQANPDVQHVEALERTSLLWIPILNLLWCLIACSTALVRYHKIRRRSQSARAPLHHATGTSATGTSSTGSHQTSTPAAPTAGSAAGSLQLHVLPAWMVTACLVIKGFWMPVLMSGFLPGYVQHPLPHHLAPYTAMYFISSAARGSSPAPFIACCHIASMVSRAGRCSTLMMHCCSGSRWLALRMPCSELPERLTLLAACLAYVSPAPEWLLCGASHCSAHARLHTLASCTSATLACLALHHKPV